MLVGSSPAIAGERWRREALRGENEQDVSHPCDQAAPAAAVRGARFAGPACLLRRPGCHALLEFPACKTEAETEPKLQYLAKTSSPYDYLAWAVADKRSDRCIGMVNYHHREARNEKLEIGYILAPAQQGRGLMTEAVAALVAYCFDELAAHRIEALIHPDNAASIRLVERLGFLCEGGPLRDRWRVGERLHERDDVCASLPATVLSPSSS